jgi:hypothetical protein
LLFLKRVHQFLDEYQQFNTIMVSSRNILMRLYRLRALTKDHVVKPCPVFLNLCAEFLNFQFLYLKL